MTNHPFLFLAGEYKVSLPIVYSKNNWDHSMIANYIDFDTKLHRRDRVEDIKGVILFADLDNKDIEQHNLNSIIKSNIPCYPDPTLLLYYINRHTLHQSLIKISGVDNKFEDYDYDYSYSNIGDPSTNFRKLPELLEARLKKTNTLVLKTGLFHRGLNKYLLKSVDDFNQVEYFEGLFTLGPYYTGDSVRVLFVKDNYFVFEIQNDESWVKNSAGGSIVLYNDSDYDSRLIEHAKKIKNFINLDIVGVDYIVNKRDNKIYFLEANHFPDLNVSDESVDVAKKFFLNKMNDIENKYNAIRENVLKF